MCQKYIIEITEEQQFPFNGQKQHCREVVVRKKISFSNCEEYSHIQHKMRLLIGLSSPYLVKILRILERKNQYLTIDYQYVRDSLLRYPKVMDHTFLSNLKDKLVELYQLLSESCIKLQIKIENIGLTVQGQVKVYIDPSFQIMPETQKPFLKKDYHLQIQKLFQTHFSFRTSIRAHSQLSDYSSRLDRKISAIQEKINRRNRRKSHDSGKNSAKSHEQSKKHPPNSNIVLESLNCRMQKGSSNSQKTSHSYIDPQNRTIKSHKFSYHQESKHILNESVRTENSLTKRLNTALQKSKQTFKLYEKYFKRKNML